jgi:katanin p60 ATPase-containing subunit A1
MFPIELQRSVKSAREFAMQCKYEASITFYNGIDAEISKHIATLSADERNARLRGRWEELKITLQEERQAIQDIQAELKAFSNPAEAVRRDRGIVAGPSDRVVAGGSGEYPGSGFPRDWRPDIPAPDLGAPVVQSVGGKNEVNFGDRDRFGAGYVPPRSSGAPSRVPNGGWNKRAGASPIHTPTAGFVPPAPAAPNSASKESKAKDRVKPPLPKFGKAEKGSNQPQENGKSRAPKYVGRPGEEELVASIEADMSFGNTNVHWDDVAGHREAKALLEEAVIYPVLMPDYFQGIRRPWKGVLLYGPPGTGKTMLAKAVATECDTTFFNISPATLTSKWRGDSEKMVRILFEMARHYAPSTIFIDEIDSLCGQRGGDGEHEASRRAKSVLLTQMDGLGVDASKVVMVLGATNHPWDIDEAMRRRLERRIYIPLPNEEDILQLLQINTRSIKLDSDVDLQEVARLAASKNYSAHDLTVVVRAASMVPMRRFIEQQRGRKDLKTHANEISKQVAQDPVTMADLVDSIRKTPSSVNLELLDKFVAWKKEFEANASG